MSFTQETTDERDLLEARTELREIIDDIVVMRVGQCQKDARLPLILLAMAHGYTYDEIGEALGLGAQRVRQLSMQAFRLARQSRAIRNQIEAKNMSFLRRSDIRRVREISWTEINAKRRFTFRKTVIPHKYRPLPA